MSNTKLWSFVDGSQHLAAHGKHMNTNSNVITNTKQLALVGKVIASFSCSEHPSDH